MSVWVERGTIVFPQSADIPVIMVGPGTGLAPFRSFIHDRMSQNIPGNPPLTVCLALVAFVLAVCDFITKLLGVTE